MSAELTPAGETLELRSRRDHGRADLNHCPRCGADLMAVGIPDLVYVFDRCDCPVAPFTHLVEQLWHRTCHAAEAAAQLVDRHDDLIAAARRDALAEAVKAILAEANRGPGAAPPRQQLTYPGGLRRAARIVDALLGRARGDHGR